MLPSPGSNRWFLASFRMMLDDTLYTGVVYRK